MAMQLAFNQSKRVRFSQGGPHAGIAQLVERDGATVEAVDSESTARTNLVRVDHSTGQTALMTSKRRSAVRDLNSRPAH